MAREDERDDATPGDGDDADTLPIRKRRKPLETDDAYEDPAEPEKRGGMPLWGWLLIGFGVLVLLCGGIGVVGMALLWTSERPEMVPQQAEQKAKKFEKAQPQAPPPITK